MAAKQEKRYSTWPSYQINTARGITLPHLKKLLTDKQAIIALGNIAFFIVIYFLGTHISLPFTRVAIVQKVITQSLLLSAINELFTGGALGYVAPFSLGVFPLPLLYGGITSVVGSRLRIQPRLTIPSLIAVTALASLVVLWLMVIGAIPNTILFFIITLFYFLVGAWLLFLVDRRLTKYGGPDIVSLNALLIGVSYLRSLLLSHRIIDLLVVLLVGLFILFLILLTRKATQIELRNIKEEKVKKGVLLIPATNSVFQSVLLITTFALVAAVTTLINLFFNLGLTPFGHSPLDVLILLLILVGIVVLFSRTIFIDSLLSQFNSTATARTLMLNYWLIPDKQVGAATARYLTWEAMKSHRLTYMFYTVSIMLFSLIGLVTSLFHMPITPLPFGPLVFIIILALCSQLGYGIITTSQRYIQSINFDNFWTLPRSTAYDLQPLLAPYDVAEFVSQFLPDATGDEQEVFAQTLVSLAAGKLLPKDIPTALGTMRRIVQRGLGQEPGNAPKFGFNQFVLRLGACILVAVIITAIVTWATSLVAPTTFTDFSIRAGLVAFFFATLLVFLTPVLGLNELILALVKRLTPDKSSAAVEQETPETILEHRLDIRQNEILAQQRQIIEDKRRDILIEIDIHKQVLAMIRAEVSEVIDSYTLDTHLPKEKQVEELLIALHGWVSPPESLLPEDLSTLHLDTFKQQLIELTVERYEQRDAIGQQVARMGLTGNPLRNLERNEALRIIDHYWADYIDKIHVLRANMRVRSASPQSNPLAEFSQEANTMFMDLQGEIRFKLVDYLLTVPMTSNVTMRPIQRLGLPSSELQPSLPQTLPSSADDTTNPEVSDTQVTE